MSVNAISDDGAATVLRLASNFAAADGRATFAAATALRDAVLGAAVTSADPGVCRTQLDWWRLELERLRDGNARHPAGVALQQCIVIDAHRFTLMQEWLVAAERLLQRDNPDDVISHRIAAFRHYGTVLSIAFDPERRHLESCRECAAALWMLHRRHQPDAVANDESLPALIGRLQNIAADTPVPLAIVAALTGARLARIRRDQTSPGALAELFHAWRVARRTRKH